MFKAIQSTMREAAVLMFIIILILKPEFILNADKWKAWEAYVNLPNRLLETIQSHIIQAEQTVESTNEMRFMYEESPHYEMGYVTGEIIERYRKAVEFAKLYARHNHSASVYTILYRLELTQKLYFEAYHLVQMLNEIPRKYASNAEFRDLTADVDHDEVMRLHRIKERERKRKESAVKKMAKLYKKLSEAYAKSKIGAYAEVKSPENKRWPLDYGWEIDPDW